MRIAISTGGGDAPGLNSVIRAATLHKYLSALTNDNAQSQFYLTDIIEAIGSDGGEIRTCTTSPSEPEYDLLCSDVTKPMDLALLEGILASKRGLLFSDEIEIEEAARVIAAGRPRAQVASIARQLGDIMEEIRKEQLPFDHEHPVAIGVAGGRLRLAFMHPDMVRFHGPAWQMPIGAGAEEGEEQIVLLLQAAGDHRIHLHPIDRKYRENVNFVPTDNEAHYPGEHIADLHSYEAFGTSLSENLLLQLGYFADEELDTRRTRKMPLPPSTLWVSNNIRRPFAVHVNRQQADPNDVKNFLRKAFYQRFGLHPQPEFVEVHPGGGASAVRLKNYDVLSRLIQRLRFIVAA